MRRNVILSAAKDLALRRFAMNLRFAHPATLQIWASEGAERKAVAFEGYGLQPVHKAGRINAALAAEVQL